MKGEKLAIISAKKLLSISGVEFRHAVGVVAGTCFVVDVLVKRLTDLATHIERAGDTHCESHGRGT